MASHHGNRGTKRRHYTQDDIMDLDSYRDYKYYEEGLHPPRPENIEPGNVSANNGMDGSMAGEGLGGGGGGSLVNPTLHIGASNQWDVTVVVSGGTNNSLNTYDLFNIACEQSGLSFAQRLDSPQDERCTKIMCQVHDMEVVANNTNTVIGLAVNHSGDGILPTPMQSGVSNAAPQSANSTIARPNFMVQKQHLQFPVTGSTTAVIKHNFNGSKQNRPYVLDTDVSGRAYAQVDALQLDPTGADAQWVARVRATFHCAQVVGISQLRTTSNMDIRTMMKKEYREMIPEVEREQICETDWIQKQMDAMVDRKEREAERIKMIKYKRMMGIDDDGSKY